MSTFIILFWHHRCTVFIWVDAHFKQGLVWLRMHTCVTVFVLQDREEILLLLERKATYYYAQTDSSCGW